MRHLKTIFAVAVMLFGLMLPSEALAQEWEGTSVDKLNPSESAPAFLYNVGSKKFLINSGLYGTQVCLNGDYGLPIWSVKQSGSYYNIQTGLKTNQGKHICLSNGTTDFFTDHEAGQSGYNVSVTLAKVSGTTNNEYTLKIGNYYITSPRNPNDGDAAKGTTATDGDYSKWIFVSYETIQKKLQTTPADLENPTNITYSLRDPSFDRGSQDLPYWKPNFTPLGSTTAWEKKTSISSGNTVIVGDGTNFIKINGTTITNTTNKDEATVWTVGNNNTLKSGNYYLGYSSSYGSNTLRVSTSSSEWDYSSTNGFYYNSYIRYNIRYSNGWTLARSGGNIGYAYAKTTAPGNGGLKVGAQHLYTLQNTGTFDVSEGKTSSYPADLGEWGYKQAYGKYFGAEVRDASGTLTQTAKVYYAGWYRVSCQGFYWNTKSAPTENTTTSVFVEVDGTSAKQYLALANANNLTPPTTWQEGADALFKKKYTNYIMFFVTPEMLGNPTPIINTDKEGNEYEIYYNAKGVDFNFGIEIESCTSGDWACFDDFQLDFMGYNKDLVLLEDNLDHEYIMTTKENYRNETLRLNRKFTLNAWNTLVLPVSLTINQFVTAFGQNARCAELKSVGDGVLHFETKTKLADRNTVMIEAGKPYIVYITTNPTHTTPYTVSLTKINGGGLVTKSIGGRDYPYYVIPRVTLANKAVLDHSKMGAVENAYTVNDGNKSVKFNGTYEKTYEGTAIRTGYSDMVGNIIFKGGDLWWLDDTYGMKAYRAWLEPTGYGTESPARMAFSLDGVEDDATYIYGIEAGDEENTVNQFSNGVYSINGAKMDATSIDNLPKGVYIVNGKKFIAK